MTQAMLLLAAVRFHRRYVLQFVLSLAGIALGVAVFVGVDVANTSANAAFETSADFVRGATTHRLLPLERSLDEQLFVERIALQGIVGAPIIEQGVRIPATGARANLLGVDAIEEVSFRDATRLGILGGVAPETLITVPSTAVISSALLTDPTADAITLRTGSGDHTLQIVGTLPQDSGMSNLIVVDIATAQEITGMIGQLTRIDLILDAAALNRLQADLPRDTALVVAGAEDQAFQQLSNAFRINILALGLLALAVGMFLVYSSANFSLVRRARTFGILRTLGTGRRELGFGIILEFLVIGCVASLLGVALGHALAGVLVELMLLTVSDFSFRNEVAVSDASLWLYAKGAIVGLAATLLAAFGPIRHAVQRDSNAALQRSALESRANQRSAAGIIAALVLLVAGAVLLSWPGRSLIIAFCGLFAALAAAASATPAVAAVIVAAFARLTRKSSGFILLQAARNVLAQQSRIAVASSALMLAVACVIGVGVMIDSFRSSLQAWLDTTLTSDIYISLSGDESPTESLIGLLDADERIADYSLTRITEIPGAYGVVPIRAFEPGQRGWGIQAVEGETNSAVELLESGNGIAITEPFALRSGLSAGDQLRLPVGDSERSFDIVAVYRDYNAGGASVLMALSLYRQLWRDDGIDGIGLELASATEIDDVEADVAAQLRSGAARITTATGIKSVSLEIFDRTFLITEVLRILAGGIAFLGMLSALMALQLARRREFGILRSLGFAPRDLRRMILTETGIMGVCAGVIAVPVGIALSAALVFVINVRSFGWTMEFTVLPSALLPGLLLAVAAAVLAGIAPAFSSYRHPVADALRDA